MAIGCALVVLAASDAAAAAQSEPIVTLSLSAAEVALGQPFYAFVEVSVEAGMEVSLPEGLSFGNDIEELRRELTPSKREGRDLYTYELTLMCFQLGELEIPEIPIVYAASAGAREVRTAVSRISVVGRLKEGEGSLQEVVPDSVVRRDMERVYTVAGFALGLGLLSVLGALGGRVLRRYRTATPGPVRTALDIARNRLDEVEASTLLTEKESRKAFVAMSEIVREYLGNALGTSALDATTAEIERDLLAIDLEEDARLEICEWLRDADLVKFAGFRANEEDTRTALYSARGWIERIDAERRMAEEVGDDKA